LIEGRILWGGSRHFVHDFLSVCLYLRPPLSRSLYCYPSTASLLLLSR
jgi:hypothetical protein